MNQPHTVPHFDGTGDRDVVCVKRSSRKDAYHGTGQLPIHRKHGRYKHSSRSDIDNILNPVVAQQLHTHQQPKREKNPKHRERCTAKPITKQPRAFQREC